MLVKSINDYSMSVCIGFWIGAIVLLGMINLSVPKIIVPTHNNAAKINDTHNYGDCGSYDEEECLC